MKTKGTGGLKKCLNLGLYYAKNTEKWWNAMSESELLKLFVDKQLARPVTWNENYENLTSSNNVWGSLRIFMTTISLKIFFDPTYNIDRNSPILV